jgi:hypothetical protein
MSLIIPSNSVVSGGYNVDNSCMFNYADGAYLNRTLGTPTNNIRWTWSTWIKRSKITGSQQRIFFAVNGAGNYTTIQFDDEQYLVWFNENGGTDMQLKTSRQFKDTNAWMNLVFVYDSANATEADRQIIYVNGVRETSFEINNPAGSSVTTAINQAVVHNIASGPGAANFYGGYMSEVVFTDGQALAVTDVGEFDEDSGIWKPKDVSGLTFGSNGFYLDFEDSANLGNDANGGTDFTEVNLAATDQATDTCTNNFATMNSLDNYYQSATFTDGNNTMLTDGSATAFSTSTIMPSIGKWYAECKIISGTSTTNVGITGTMATAASQILESRADGYAYTSQGEFGNNGTAGGYGSSYANGNIVGVAMDLDNNKLYFSKNGVFQDSGNPSAGSGGKTITAAASTTMGQYSFSAGDTNSSTRTFSWNFGSPYFAISSGNADADGFGNFEYAVPTGYFALCTKNLAEYG